MASFDLSKDINPSLVQSEDTGNGLNSQLDQFASL
jgi:hypothetical protein